MKKLTRVLCVLILILFLFPMTAKADVIYEPRDSFYEEHREECTYIGRSYTADGPNGTVTLYTSPENSGLEKTCPNGTVLYVSYTYQSADGVLWGCCDYWDEDVTGWVPMEYLELIYDEQSFSEEYADRFESVELTLDDPELTNETVRFWSYPGSRDYVEVPMAESNRPAFQLAYTDESGMQWVRCGYYMGIKGHWINLNNPTADYETLFPDAVEETVPAETEASGTEKVDEIVPGGGNQVLLLGLAVGAVVVVTAALLIALKKKKI